MKVSVLIPTLGRVDELIQTVSGLMKQTIMPDEIIVVDQNDPPNEKVVAAFNENPLVRHITGVPKGLVSSYNKCLNEAAGEIVIYLDDDVIPTESLIEAHLKNYTDESVGGVAGKILSAQDTEINPQRLAASYSPITGIVKTCFYSNKKSIVPFAQGANMSFRKKVLKQINGFNARYTGNGYFFETDAGLHIKENGWKMIFDPEAEVFHLITQAGGARIKSKSEHTYYFIKHGIFLFRDYGVKIFLPMVVIHRLLYVFLKAIYNNDMKIFFRGLDAIKEGLSR